MTCEKQKNPALRAKSGVLDCVLSPVRSVQGRPAATGRALVEAVAPLRGEAFYRNSPLIRPHDVSSARTVGAFPTLIWNASRDCVGAAPVHVMTAVPVSVNP